ncbi:FtsX-like permease family protein [Subsaximicrobium wynnwilliamsii]|uniref:FtsX-like permease family protein n=1 Tax=Subsaximicrobium wynnwilliamsii TaxID=291179 RepID=A0A5C6ZFE5_9FLAO|nr:ABC transporter permease [Subsaximicrobium wynnwilliamsii]TXD83226.1 FtsX-like permease family protein [Subsaximicrobium wynnwilliamsii]TXD88338.1 FtsX-like permease family protein [Subsaximicrobium wynnwilliamsii]TXE03059.1 FtsX-like permease family protein [Subsaximicrobium wynnwilliamsii]
MFRNHIKIAFRSLKNQPFFTLINTFGLAIGMAGSLLIGLYIYDELSYDKMFADAGRIYRIDMDIKFGGAEIKSAETAPPMAAALQRDFAEVENTVRFRILGSNLFRSSDKSANIKELSTTYVDATFFDMFGLELIDGNKETALKEANTLVMTRTAAENHFGSINVVGKSLLLNNEDTYVVTGVMEDLPKNSFLKDYSIFMAMAGNVASRENIWGSNNYFTFVKVLPATRMDHFQLQLDGLLEKYILPWAQKTFPGMTAASFAASGNYIRYHTIPLTNIHLHSDNQIEMGEKGTIQNVYILSFIGFFLIFLACVNFMNLSTAHSLKRAKEVGIRKTLGSNRIQLIVQFLTESSLISFASMILAVIVAFIALPFFNDLAGRTISIPFTEPLFYVAILLFTMVLGLFSGSYPAFVISRFIPVETLKGNGFKNGSKWNIRSMLVVFQFGIAVFLIVGTLVIFQQLQFIQNKDLGYSKEQVLVISDSYAAGQQVNAFKHEVLSLSAVKSATLSSFMPIASARSNSSFFREDAMDQKFAIQMQTWDVDHDYMKTFGMELIAGRGFNNQSVADSTATIINESTLTTLGLSAQEALGKRITEDVELGKPVFYRIIGVIKDFHYESLREDIGALGLFLNKSTGSMAVKLQTDDFASAISSIENIWNEQAPGQPFNYRFMDDAFDTSYNEERRLGNIFIVFTSLSIFIACLGLFGLAAFNAQKRTKEIGVRKVLGASVSQITFGLTTDFLKLVAIATAIALPLGWFVMNIWLQDFSYRIQISWEILAFAAFLVILIAILTVSYQSIKAAIANPVKSLKTE